MFPHQHRFPPPDPADFTEPGPFGPPDMRRGFGGLRGPRGRSRRWGGPPARRGAVRGALLGLLAEQPRIGYELIQAIGERSGGLWQPSPGAVYPALQQLEDEGLIEADASSGRRVYALTAEGQTYVAAHAEALAAAWQHLTGAEEARELHEVVGQLAQAASQVAEVGNAAQRGRARQVLVSARRTLYQILAEEETAGPAPESPTPE